MARVLIIAELTSIEVELVTRLEALGHECVVMSHPKLAMLTTESVSFDLVFASPERCPARSMLVALFERCPKLRWFEMAAGADQILRAYGEDGLRITSTDALRLASVQMRVHGLDMLVSEEVTVARTGGGPGVASNSNHGSFRRLLGDAELLQRQIAHDVKNLLTIVCASAHGVKVRAEQGQLDSSSVEIELADLSSASERAVILMQRWLANAHDGREKSAGIRVSGDGHDLRNLVSDLAPLLRRCLSPGTELSLRASGSLPRVRVEVSEFERVLLNLVINANEAMPHGGHIDIDIDVACPTQGLDAGDSQSGHQHFVRLTVADDGVGMPQDVARRIFEPTFTTKRARDGSGLGLSAVRSIIERSRGVVEVDTSPGEGTRLTVYLPAISPAKHASRPNAITENHRVPGLASRPATGPAVGLAASRSKSRTGAKRSGPSAALAHRRILVVDDEAPLRHLMVELLRGRGYDALQAADGAAALRMVDNMSHLDLLICDIRMPGRPGWEVARELCQSCVGLPVLFTSGHAEGCFARERAQIAHADFLAKPFRMDTLLGRVRRILDLSSVPRIPPSQLVESIPR